MGPAKAVSTARVTGHAKERQKQRKTSKQRAVSKTKKQMIAMGVIIRGVRADSPEDGANAEEGADTEITEKRKRGELLTI